MIFMIFPVFLLSFVSAFFFTHNAPFLCLESLTIPEGLQKECWECYGVTFLCLWLLSKILWQYLCPQCPVLVFRITNVSYRPTEGMLNMLCEVTFLCLWFLPEILWQDLCPQCPILVFRITFLQFPTTSYRPTEGMLRMLSGLTFLCLWLLSEILWQLWQHLCRCQILVFRITYIS